MTIKPETGSHTAEEFSWVPWPFCSLPRLPFPIKSLALPACVSPQTVHFQVLDTSPLLGSGRGSPSGNTNIDGREKQKTGTYQKRLNQKREDNETDKRSRLNTIKFCNPGWLPTNWRIINFQRFSHGSESYELYISLPILVSGTRKTSPQSICFEGRGQGLIEGALI